MTPSADLSAEIAELSAAELRVLQRDFAARSVLARGQRPRVADLLHALAAALDEEACRRARVLDAVAADLEPAGEIVTDLAQHLAEARAELQRDTRDAGAGE